MHFFISKMRCMFVRLQIKFIVVQPWDWAATVTGYPTSRIMLLQQRWITYIQRRVLSKHVAMLTLLPGSYTIEHSGAAEHLLHWCHSKRAGLVECSLSTPLTADSLGAFILLLHVYLLPPSQLSTFQFSACTRFKSCICQVGGGDREPVSKGGVWPLYKD